MEGRKIIVTGDGSKTIFIPELEETYHSIHGAIGECEHVFIKNGYEFFRKCKSLNILEIGWGSGLNSLFTAMAAEPGQKIKYRALEKYPLSTEEALSLGYAKDLEKRFGSTMISVYEKQLSTPWEKATPISEDFSLKKVQTDFLEYDYPADRFDLVYFDAFGPRVQPELWTEKLFGKLYSAMKTGGRLVTYSSKGNVRRAMQATGFEVNKHPGPPGKREMSVATKS